MPKKCRRVLGGRPYQRYHPDLLVEACAAAKSGESIRSVSERLGVPRSTIQDYLKKTEEQKQRKPGRQPVLSNAEEKMLVDGIIRCSDWGVSLPLKSLGQIVQAYFNRCGRREPRFRNNLPGEDWLRLFISRHPSLSIRLADNIKRSRASVTKASIHSYFNELNKSLQGVQACCMVNYDETNFVDDPGQVKVSETELDTTRVGTYHFSNIGR